MAFCTYCVSLLTLNTSVERDCLVEVRHLASDVRVLDRASAEDVVGSACLLSLDYVYDMCLCVRVWWILSGIKLSVRECPSFTVKIVECSKWTYTFKYISMI